MGQIKRRSDVRPDNTSAIIVLREAACALADLQNRFYQFVRILLGYGRVLGYVVWQTQYKLEDSQGIWYLPFDGEKYKDLVISVKVDVVHLPFGEAQNIQIDNLYNLGY